MTNTEGTVLDLPEPRQRELAQMMGMTLDEWRNDTRESLARGRAFVAQLDANAVRYEDLTPEERERYDRFQARVDDEQRTNEALAKRKANDDA